MRIFHGPHNIGGMAGVLARAQQALGHAAESVCHSHQINQRLRSHLSHDLPAMKLHRCLAKPNFRGNLLVKATSDDQRHHLALTLRQRFECGP